METCYMNLQSEFADITMAADRKRMRYDDTNTRGISLVYLAELASKYRKTMKVAEFVLLHIKPKTAQRNESYVNMLARDQPQIVSNTAQCMVSFMWSCSLHELMTTLEYTLLTQTGERDVFVWLDAFCINQHQMKGTLETQQTLQESIMAIGHVVLVNCTGASVFEEKSTGMELLLDMNPNRI